MLTHAIGVIQTAQLLCFAIIFMLMVLKDRGNRTIGWIACAYLAGLVGGLLQLGHRILPDWAPLGLFMEAAPIGYACLHAGIAHFVGRGARTRWIPVALIALTLPLCLLWSNPAQAVRGETLTDLVLALQTSLTAWLLLSTRDLETLWPRRVIAGFLSLYATVEYTRVAVFLLTRKSPDLAANWIAVPSGIVYVVACSVLPLAVIWMIYARLHARMKHDSTSDPLTQLLNRRGIQAAGEHELARYVRSRQEFSLVLFDIDYFKHLNDTFGHVAGDLVLRETAALLQSLLRDTDRIGRLGGEEFALLLPNTPVRGAELMVERLRLTLQIHTFQLAGRTARITSSFGITASAARTGLTWDTLLNEADQALYAAKRAGRNRAALHPADSSDGYPSASTMLQTV